MESIKADVNIDVHNYFPEKLNLINKTNDKDIYEVTLPPEIFTSESNNKINSVKYTGIQNKKRSSTWIVQSQVNSAGHKEINRIYDKISYDNKFDSLNLLHNCYLINENVKNDVNKEKCVKMNKPEFIEKQKKKKNEDNDKDIYDSLSEISSFFLDGNTGSETFTQSEESSGIVFHVNLL